MFSGSDTRDGQKHGVYNITPHYITWGDGGGGHWLVRMEWHPAGWLVCLPLLIIFPCTIKCRSSLLAPAHRVVLKKGRKTVVVHYSLLLHQKLAVQEHISGSFSSPLLWLMNE